jgi:hypothetical protein
VNNHEYRRNRRHINPVPPIATDKAIGPEQINCSDPVNEDDTMQASPAVPSTSVEAKNFHEVQSAHATTNPKVLGSKPVCIVFFQKIEHWNTNDPLQDWVLIER